jgi:glucose/arabinose dehydrogenase
VSARHQRRWLSACVLLTCALLVAGASRAQVLRTQEYALRVERVVEGLRHPWGLAFLPDGRMLVTEREGRLRVISADRRLDPVPVAGLPRVDPHGQGGLLDVVLHPQYAKNGWIYWSYVQRDDSGYGTEVARGKLAGAPGGYRLEQVQVIFRLARKSDARQHFGSRLVFDREGLLYVTLGDRGDMQRAQRLDDHAGKILRLTDEGKPAPNNPLAATAGTLPEIYSLGHRNVQGATLHPKTGVLWAIEHGPQGGDELNVVKAGRNYGWPVITYGVNYGIGTRIGEGTHKAGMEQPVKYWVPSPAICGFAFYEGDRFPRWRGDALIGALRGHALIRVRLDGERFVAEEFMLRDQVPRLRDVRIGPDGLVYLLTDEENGAVLRLEPA